MKDHVQPIGLVSITMRASECIECSEKLLLCMKFSRLIQITKPVK